MDPVDRLAGRLHAVLSASAADPECELTVGDLYQRLIPYRAVRAEIGFFELAEYEHALLRLLAGEKGHLEAADPEVRDEIRRELGAVNPILGLYRDYAGEGVRLLPDAASARDPEPVPAARPLSSPSSPSRGPDESGHRRTPPPRPHAPAREAHPANQDACRSCRRSLPATDELRFCPFCGHAQDPEPCSRCGTPLDVGWNFCIRCGTPRAGVPRGA